MPLREKLGIYDMSDVWKYCLNLTRARGVRVNLFAPTNLTLYFHAPVTTATVRALRGN